jgi:undecaprenyl-diphosphatase
MILIVLGICAHGWRRFKRKGIILILGMFITFGLTDSISSRILKPMTKRLRPCHEEVFKDQVHLAGQKCWGGKYGFVSSHAANTFGLATLFLFIFKSRVYLGLLAYATLVSYSRIYLAKHYPLDIFFGALLGIIVGYSIYLCIQPLLIRKKLF